MADAPHDPTAPATTGPAATSTPGGRPEEAARSELAAQELLDACAVDPEVLTLRPDYRAVLMVADNLPPQLADGSTGKTADKKTGGKTEEHEPGASPGYQHVEELVSAAQAYGRQLLASSAVETLPHVAAWRQAYRAFGAKPQRTRNSLEALLRRTSKGLPRINALTDIYNAVSILHQLPLGGEDLSCYEGPAGLVRATGGEVFETTAHGEPAIEHPEPGEVVWRDDAGVTCRRWNWRQCRRTALTGSTQTAFFILDALAPLTDSALDAAADALAEALTLASPRVSVVRRTISR